MAIKKSVEKKMMRDIVGAWLDALDDKRDEIVQMVVDDAYDLNIIVDDDFIYDDVPRLLKQALMVAAKNITF